MRLPSLILVCLLGLAEAYKILVYNPKFGYSHATFLGQIADILVESGDNVTSLISVYDKNIKDGTTKSKRIYVDPIPDHMETYDAKHRHAKSNLFNESPFNPIGVILGGQTIGEQQGRQCEFLLQDDKLIEMLKAEKFDVMIAENFDMCGVGLSHVLQPKAFIGASSSLLFGPQYDEFGIPTAISYNPSLFTSQLDVHSAWSRAWNAYGDLLTRLMFRFGRNAVQEAFRAKYGEEFPSLAEIASHAAYVFTNSEPLLDFATPTLTRVVHVPGINSRSPKRLDKKWEVILTKRERTILISFGTNYHSVYLPAAVKEAFLSAISRFPNITFIWKYEDPNDEFCRTKASKLPNLELTPWMPQNDILAHKRLAIFITHGGMASMQETAARGVPGVYIPVMGDQPRNAFMMEHNGLGKVLDKQLLADPNNIVDAINEVLEPRYRTKAQHVARVLAAKPFTSRELIVKYTHFAATFGPSESLRPSSQDMSFVAYHNLDLVAIVLLIFIVIAYATRKLIKFIRRKCGGGRRRGNSKNKFE